jgi:GDPmannose 4,6-dehydratase
MKNKTALITGVTGQDGSYLAELLLSKGYNVIGVKRRTSLITTDRIDNIFNDTRFTLEYGNLHDAGCFWRLLKNYYPDEIYNLAAQSHVRVSFDVSEETVDSIAMGTLRLLNAYRQMCPEAKFYQASSSEMYGDNPLPPFNEETPFCPASPYACAKVFAHNLIRNYRESYNLHASSGILFNHESPRRGETFVTRKITIAAARIKLGLQDKLHLGNLDARRDWGFAGDYTEAMWLMLQQDNPDDYVIATGKSYTVKEFLECVFDYAGLGSPDKYISIDARLFRPHEVPYLLGDPTKAKKKLNWEPKVNFEELAKMMYDADLKDIRRKL